MPQTYVVDNLGLYKPLKGAYVATATNTWTAVKKIYVADAAGVWKRVFPPDPTYAINASPQSTNEGSSVTFTLTTTNVDDGTLVPYALSGSGINSVDISGAATTGNFTVNGNTSSKTFVIAADNTTEGTEYLTMTVGGVSTTVTINDTSITPPVYNPTIAFATTALTLPGTVNVTLSGGPPNSSVYIVSRNSSNVDMPGATTVQLNGAGAGSYSSAVHSAYVNGTYTFYAYFDNTYLYTGGYIRSQVFTVTAILYPPGTFGVADYAIAGDYVLTIPASSTNIRVVVIGGGGGGSGFDDSSGELNGNGGYAGGAQDTGSILKPGSTVYIHVGAGGAAGVYANPGGAGGYSAVSVGASNWSAAGAACCSGWHPSQSFWYGTNSYYTSLTGGASGAGPMGAGYAGGGGGGGSKNSTTGGPGGPGFVRIYY